MNKLSLLALLQDNGFAQWLGSSRYLTMVIQSVHLLSLTLLLALAAGFALRSKGWLLGSLSLSGFTRALQRPYQLALVLALGAGLLLFLPRAVVYGANKAFVVKAVLLVLAVAAQLLLTRHVLRNDLQQASRPLQLASVATLLLWFGTGVAGRAIGFV
jgi:hypothetical protein